MVMEMLFQRYGEIIKNNYNSILIIIVLVFHISFIRTLKLLIRQIQLTKLIKDIINNILYVLWGMLMAFDFDDVSNDLIEYIEVRNDFYFVKKKSKNNITTFGKFNSMKEACAAVCLLLKNKWKLKNVVNNPLVNYGDEFWVFNINNDKLALDKKFSDFESAVEYIEINDRYNDYNNDILSTRRERKRRIWAADNEFYEEEFQDEFIQKKWGKYIIERSLKNANFKYAEFDTLEEAKVAKNLLLDNRWNIDNNFEMVFYNNFYWIFEFSQGVLIYLNKLESFEEAFDFIESIKDGYILNKDNSKDNVVSQNNNFEQVSFKKNNNHIGKRPINVVKSKKRVKSKQLSELKFTYNYMKDLEHSKNIWVPKFKNPFIGSHISVIVARGGVKVKKLDVDMIFSFYKEYYDVTVKGYGLKSHDDYSIDDFPEFPLIIKIFETNNWSLLNIKTSSSIYYFNSKYYKILVLERNKLIFQEFTSYYLAENMIVTYNKMQFDKDSFYCPLDVVKKGKSYDLVKINKGIVIRVHPSDSLEEMKMIHTILVNEQWNLKIFDKYDYFYLNGLYWLFERKGTNIKLIGKFESIGVESGSDH